MLYGFFYSIGNVGCSPGVALTLLISVFKRTKPSFCLRRVNAGGKIQRFNHNLSFIFKKGLQKQVPVFRNYVSVPIADAVQKLKR